MKFQLRIVLTLLAAFAVLEGTSRLLAQETAPPRRKSLNPSSAFPPVNPSQEIRPINPSEVIPPFGPNRSNRVTPPPTDGGGFKEPPVIELPLTTQVVISISEGPERLQGLTPSGRTGIPVRNLRVQSERGKVMLFGSVGSQREKTEAGARAEELAGSGKVINRLSVAP